MRIVDLSSPPGANKKPKRRGMGPGSGHGKTSCRGHKGSKARSGHGHLRPGFEGGQMPLIRRVPKRGFINEFKKKIEIVNLSALDSFEANSTITPEILKEKRIIRKLGDGVKILGEGELLKPLIVQANYFSRKAQEKIEKAGGKVEVI